MDRKVALVLLSLLLASKSFGFVWFGGLTEAVQYKSALPCITDAKVGCTSNQGIMGMTLDQASKSGLNIIRIKEISGNNLVKVYVQTHSHGYCQVEARSIEDLGDVFFLCSTKGFNKHKKLDIDGIYTLDKQADDTFKLIEISTQSKPRHG